MSEQVSHTSVNGNITTESANDSVFSRDVHDSALAILNKNNGWIVRHMIDELKNRPFIAFFLWDSFDPRQWDALIEARNKVLQVLSTKNAPSNDPEIKKRA